MIARFFRRVRRAAFPTRKEHYDDGIGFALSELGGTPTERQIERLLATYRFDMGDPFDQGVADYCLSRMIRSTAP
jgi:hypothetical protein